MDKVRVGVLRGGPSEEYEVSLKTGASVIRAMDRTRFEPIDVVITKRGEWLVDGFERYPEKILSFLDVVFLALHGEYGEDGTVQRLLDKYGVKYTGSRAFPSSIAIHKILTKDKLRGTGIKMPRHMSVHKESLQSIHQIADSIKNLFGPQYIIKPIARGSSVGTIAVTNASDLPTLLAKALNNYDEVMVEERIKGREATCGVVENYRSEKVYALPPIEIVPPQTAGFFDYRVKYDGSTQEICPARFSLNTKREIESIAKLVHQTLDLSQYSRSDFIVADDGIYFLEVNTLPGLTEQSLLPKAIETVGGTYQGFITHLLTDRLERV